MRAVLALTGIVLLTGACAHSVAGRDRATAVLRDAGGREVGQATLLQAGSNSRLTVTVSGMGAGQHGIHIHTVGRCDPPDFVSAGPHWNPTGRQHGKDNPAGMHKGDLPNLQVGTGGSGRMTEVLPDIPLGTLLDVDGSAIVVHAAPDDYRTDPSGNSGGRVACGVLTAA